MRRTKNALEENLVTFAETLDLASEKVSIFRLSEFTLSQRNMDISCIHRQCSRDDYLQIGNPERVTEIHPFKKVETGVDGDPHLRRYLSSLGGLEPFLDISLQESPAQAFVDYVSDPAQEGFINFSSGIAIPR